MAAGSQIWHYGLMAERWAETLTETPELDYLQKKIDKFGEPVLDVACGTGRLLLPLARSGVEVDGLEYSADMLALCRKKAAAQGLSLELYQQSMATMQLPKKYRMIYIIGSFGLAGSRADDLDTLRRCYQSLQPGGALVFNIQAEYTWLESWQKWSTEMQHALPEPWPTEPRDKQAADGTIHRAYFRLVDIDPLEQRYTRQVKLEKWQNGQRIAAEEYSLSGNMYLKNEVQLMLQMAGFHRVELEGDFQLEAATAASEELTLTAVKQGDESQPDH